MIDRRRQCSGRIDQALRVCDGTSGLPVKIRIIYQVNAIIY